MGFCRCWNRSWYRFISRSLRVVSSPSIHIHGYTKVLYLVAESSARDYPPRGSLSLSSCLMNPDLDRLIFVFPQILEIGFLCLEVSGLISLNSPWKIKLFSRARFDGFSDFNLSRMSGKPNSKDLDVLEISLERIVGFICDWYFV